MIPVIQDYPKETMKKKTISTASVVGQSKDIIASDIDDEKVMMNMEKGHYYGLDSVGCSVWNMLEKPIAVSELIATLRRHYDVDLETCERDVLIFLEELQADGIIDVVG